MLFCCKENFILFNRIKCEIDLCAYVFISTAAHDVLNDFYIFAFLFSFGLQMKAHKNINCRTFIYTFFRLNFHFYGKWKKKQNPF